METRAAALRSAAPEATARSAGVTVTGRRLSIDVHHALGGTDERAGGINDH